MPNFHRSGQPGGPGALDWALDALLAGDLLPDDAVAGLQPVAGLVAALKAAPAGHELGGHTQALAEFRRVAVPERAARTATLANVPRTAGAGRPSRHGRPARGRRRLLPPLRSARLAAAGGALAAALGGLATAAYAGVLPAPAQQFAHDIIGAPAPRASQQPGPQITPSAIPPTSPAAQGLCVAYARAQAHGTAAQQAAAFRKLAAAAGGAGDVADFCAATPQLGGSPAGHPSQHPSGKPSGKPTPRTSGKPSAQPTPHPTGQPSAQPTPTPHPTGKPSAQPSGKPSLSPSHAP